MKACLKRRLQYSNIGINLQPHGLKYSPITKLIDDETLEQILKRVEILIEQSGITSVAKKEEIFAVLGGEPKPATGSVKVSK